MPDETIPGIDPIELPMMDPVEWITTTGRITYRKARGVERSERCDDCLHITQQFLAGQPFPRPPGLARAAVSVRTQQDQQVLLCATHQQRRHEKENPKL